MAQENKTQDTTVEKVDINIDELFAAAPDADAIVTPETKQPKSILTCPVEMTPNDLFFAIICRFGRNSL